MVSSRSFVIGLAAAKVDQPSIFNSLRLKNLATQTDLAIDTVGYSRVTVGFDRFNEPISELRIHALLSEPLSKGHRHVIDLQLDGVPALEFTYQTDFTSPSIQVNQVGYLPNTGKHAFAGNWLGTAGSMPVDDTEFFIIRTGSGDRVFRGQLKKITELDTWSGNAVYKADFGDLQEEGEYILSIDGLGQSHPFRISKEVFRPVFRSVFRLFYHSRNSTAIIAPWADPGFERPAGIPAELTSLIHPAVTISAHSDNEIPESYKRVWRGWFDAGDYGQYVANVAPVWHAFGVGMDLMPGFFSSDNFNLPESHNGIPDILDELEWGMDWLLSMQNPGNGGVYSRSVPVIRPRHIFEITSHATASFAAMTAMHSRLMAKWKPLRAAQALAAARAAWGFLETTGQWPAESELYRNPKNVHAGEYADDSAIDNRLWAAAELYRTTREIKFKMAFIDLFGRINKDPTERVSFRHQSMAAVWSMYTALDISDQTKLDPVSDSDKMLKNELAKILVVSADWYLRKADEHPFDAPVHQHMEYTGWGSFAHSTRAVLPLLQAGSITGNPSKSDSIAEPLNGIPVNGPHFHLPAIWPATRAVNDTYLPGGTESEGAVESNRSYPPLRRYVDSNLLPPMSEPTVAEYALTSVAFGLLGEESKICITDL
jgi:hypothetical protein